MPRVRENNRKRGLDKNLQDDWIPDQENREGATSKERTEYGGDLKRTIIIKHGKLKENLNSHEDLKRK